MDSVISNDAPDQQAIEEAHKRLAEFTERTNFHRGETERFERCARAEAARLVELQAVAPVPASTPEDYMKGAQEHAKVGGGSLLAREVA
jgi:hypothetical protein